VDFAGSTPALRFFYFWRREMKVNGVYTDELRAYYAEFWDVDLENGIVTWKKARGGTKVGEPVGALLKSKNTTYRLVCITLDGKTKLYKLHRILVALREGREISDLYVDHIDGNGLNNRSDNLRLATQQENQKNRKLNSNNLSGYSGVYWNKAKQKWRACIKVDGKEIHLGYFDKLEDAVAARQQAEIKYGYHENHGRQNNA
jgi:hypothetical protein